MFTFRIDDEVSLALPRPSADASPLFDLIAADRDELATHFDWVTTITSSTAEQDWLQQTLQAFADHSALHLVIHYCDEIAGMIAFTRPDWANHSTAVRFWLGAAYRRQTIMQRALAGMCALGFTDYPWHRLQLRIAADNRNAQRVATGAGFVLEGTSRDGLLRDDGYHDVLQYARLKTD